MTVLVFLLFFLSRQDRCGVCVAVGPSVCVCDANIKDTVALVSPEAVDCGISAFPIYGLTLRRLLGRIPIGLLLQLLGLRLHVVWVWHRGGLLSRG